MKKSKYRYFEWGDEKPGYVTTWSVAPDGSVRIGAGRRLGEEDMNSNVRSADEQKTQQFGNNRRRKKMKGLDYIGWITASGIAEARHYSGICDNVKVLKSALKREKEFKNRKTVIRMLEVRIRKLEKEKKHV